MLAGLLLVGTMIGMLSGVIALGLGYSLWASLLVYAGVGVLGVLVLAGALAVRPRPRVRPQGRHYTQRAHDLSPVTRG